MKKVLKKILVIIIILLFYQFIVIIFINKHNSDYTISTKDNKYKIKEEYEQNNYLFSIRDKNKIEFVYYYKKDLNKQSKIITDIISYKKDNLYCIAPVLKKSIENIVCKLDNKLVNYQYLKQIKDNRVDKFIKRLENTTYEHDFIWKNENKSIKEKYNLTIYNDISKEYYITFWNYSRIFILNNSEIKKIALLKKDAYENKHSILVDKYYITVNTDKDYYNNFYVIDIITGKKVLLKTKEEISKKIYYNGVYKNNLYLTDKENEKQYIISAKNKSIKETEPKYFDGKEMLNVSIKELIGKNKYFIKNNSNKKIRKKYNNFYLKNGYIYQKIKNKEVILFKFDDFKELKIIDDNIFGISNDTLYIYNNRLGLKKIFSNRELIYNYKNIYEIYKN